MHVIHCEIPNMGIQRTVVQVIYLNRGPGVKAYHCIQKHHKYIYTAILAFKTSHINPLLVSAVLYQITFSSHADNRLHALFL